jgi:two-component system sensor histidine kinase MprB
MTRGAMTRTVATRGAMSFSRRLVVLTATAVAIAVVLGSAATYVIARADLLRGVDHRLQAFAAGTTLRTSASPIERRLLRSDIAARLRHILDGGASEHQLDSLLGPHLSSKLAATLKSSSSSSTQVVLPRTRLQEPAGYAQYVTHNGQVALPLNPGRRLLAVSPRTLAVANGDASAFFADATIAGLRVRTLTAPLHGGAIQAVLPLDEVDATLASLRWVLLLVSIAGVALAAGLGVLVARTATSPVTALTRIAERISATRDLSERIDVNGTDELGRLATSFNRMLSALEASSQAQRQLVADVSHELRTPLASLMMNIELLAENGRLARGDRQRILRDVVEQIRELTVLVGDLVDLARQEPMDVAVVEVHLDRLVAAAVARAELHAPTQRFSTRYEPCVVAGVPARLERAVNNMLDNAAKWSPPDTCIEVTVADGEICVRDHGPGFTASDLPLIFDRFYRSSAARGLPGAGLGLAIVRQVADAHGGTVEARNAPDGGAVLRLRLALAIPERLPA